MQMKVILFIKSMILLLSLPALFGCQPYDRGELIFITFDRALCFSNLNKWDALGIENYKFTYSSNHQYGVDSTADLVVEAGLIKSYSYKDSYGNDVVVKPLEKTASHGELSTIERLFYVIAGIYDSGNDHRYRDYQLYFTSIDVEYDEFYHYPKSIISRYHLPDSHSDGERDWSIYRISNFQTF